MKILLTGLAAGIAVVFLNQYAQQIAKLALITASDSKRYSFLLLSELRRRF
jgi:hypothetical protein